MSITDELKSAGFRFKKSLGQNFLTDINLLRAIVDDAGITASDTVIEIGAGAGTLTMQLAKTAKSVIAFEIDESVLPFLYKTVEGCGNVQVINADILKTAHDELRKLSTGAFKVVANLPYYITTPVLFYFLQSSLDVQGLTVMVQREVAERLVAQPKTKAYGALSLAVAAQCKAQIMRHVPRTVFMPMPNVDSAVVRLDVQNAYDADLSRLIACLFSMRRKTAANNLVKTYAISKERAQELLITLGLDINVRGEELTLAQVRHLNELIKIK